LRTDGSMPRRPEPYADIFGLRVLLAGVVTAGWLVVPVVNLVAPLIATALMLHVFEALPQVEPTP